MKSNDALRLSAYWSESLSALCVARGHSNYYYFTEVSVVFYNNEFNE